MTNKSTCCGAEVRHFTDMANMCSKCGKPCSVKQDKEALTKWYCNQVCMDEDCELSSPCFDATAKVNQILVILNPLPPSQELLLTEIAKIEFCRQNCNMILQGCGKPFKKSCKEILLHEKERNGWPYVMAEQILAKVMAWRGE